MNDQSPLVPQGSLLEQKNSNRARVKVWVFFVLTVHGIGLMALLMQGCRKEEPVPQASEPTNNVVAPAFEPTNTVVATDTNVPTPSVTPPPAVADTTPTAVAAP